MLLYVKSQLQVHISIKENAFAIKEHNGTIGTNWGKFNGKSFQFYLKSLLLPNLFRIYTYSKYYASHVFAVTYTMKVEM